MWRKHDPDAAVCYWRAGAFSCRRLGWGCMLRLRRRDDVRVRYIPEVLVKMRLGGVSNRSLGTILRKSAEDYRALRSNGVGGVGALAWKNLSKVPQFLRREKLRGEG